MDTSICEIRTLQRKRFFQIGLIISLGLSIAILTSSKKWQRKSIILSSLSRKEPLIITPVSTKNQMKKPIEPLKPDSRIIPSIEELLPTEEMIVEPIFPEPPGILQDNESLGWIDSIFINVEKKPQPVGGFSAIAQRLVYPPMAIKIGIEGIVIIETIIDENGTVLETNVIKSLGPYGCDKAAEQAIRSVEWEPARQRDIPVKVKVRIPVRFMLRERRDET